MGSAMKYHDLRDFLTLLEQQAGELKRITLPVDLIWKIAFSHAGVVQPLARQNAWRWAGQDDVSALRKWVKLLAFLKEPEPPKGWRSV